MVEPIRYYEVNWTRGTRVDPQLRKPCYAVVKQTGIYGRANAILLSEGGTAPIPIHSEACRIAAFIVKHLGINPGQIMWVERGWKISQGGDRIAQQNLHLITFDWRWHHIEKRWMAVDQDWLKAPVSVVEEIIGMSTSAVIRGLDDHAESI